MTWRIAHRIRRLDGSDDITAIAAGLGISLLMISAVVLSAAVSALLV